MTIHEYPKLLLNHPPTGNMRKKTFVRYNQGKKSTNVHDCLECNNFLSSKVAFSF